MLSHIYTTAQDTVERAIIPALGDHADEYDIDAIFDHAFEYSADLGGFVQTVDTDEFWKIVEAAAK